MSAAATLRSSCATLDAPGIAVTTGLRIAQASAIWAGMASWESATSRRARIRPLARSRFAGMKFALNARTWLAGRLNRSYLPDSSPWPSGL
jgi:hypothetical protein